MYDQGFHKLKAGDLNTLDTIGRVPYLLPTETIHVNHTGGGAAATTTVPFAGSILVSGGMLLIIIKNMAAIHGSEAEVLTE